MAHATMMGNGIPEEGKKKKKTVTKWFFSHLSPPFRSQIIPPGIAAIWNPCPFFFFFLSSVAPAPAKRCQEQLLLVRRDPQMRARTCHHLNLSLWMNEKLESGLTVMRSERLAGWLEGAIIRPTNSHYLHLNDTKRSHEDDAASCRVTRASLTSRESFHIISDTLSSAEC